MRALARVPALRLLLPFALGVAIEDALGLPPPAAAGPCALGLLVGAMRARRGRAAFRGGLGSAAEAALGAGLGALALALRLHAPVPAVGSEAVILTVLHPPTRAGATCHAQVFVHGDRPGRALLGVPPESCVLLPGQRALARIQLGPLRPGTNPGGASPRRRWTRRGVRAAGRVVEAQILPVGPVPRGPRAALEALRRRVGDALDPQPGEHRAGSVLRALVTAQRDRLSPEVRRPFAASGTAHLLAVSGLHVGWVFAVTHFGVGSLLRRSRSLRVLRRVHRISLSCGVTSAAAYAALAGLGVPALRAAAMALAGTLAVLGGRPGAAANALVLAALGVLAVAPASLFEPSFALSFTAVAGILLWAPPAGRLARLAHCTLGAGLATAPWVAILAAPLPVGSLLANALAIPYFGALLVPLGLASGLAGALDPELAARLRPVAHAAAELGIRMLEGLETPDLLWGRERPLDLALTLAGAGFALRLLALGRRRGALALAALAAFGLLRGSTGSAPGEGASVLVLDVGHGDATLVRTGSGAWLVDAGPKFGSYDAGRHVVAPALRAERTGRLDALVVTHSDRDHLGGAESVLERFSVGEVWMNRSTWQHAAARRLRRAAARRRVPIRVVSEGEGVRRGSLEIRVLWPPLGLELSDSNSSSLVLRFDTPWGCALLPGDVPAWVERRVARGQTRCELLKLAHHGSRSSSAALWLERLEPWVAVASSGRRSRAPLPDPSVRGRLARASVTLYETARIGALRTRFTPRGIVVEPFLAQDWSGPDRRGTRR